MSRKPIPPQSAPPRVKDLDTQRALEQIHRRALELEHRNNDPTLSGSIASSIDETDADVAALSGTIAAQFNRGYRLLEVQKFTATGTYTPTSGTLAIRSTIVGGGGGGGLGSTIAGAAGGGGSSGEWAVIWYEPGTEIIGGAVTVAAAVAGGNTGNTSTLVADGISFSAIGGNPGPNSTAVASYGEADAPSLGSAGSTSFDLYRGSMHSICAQATSTTTIAAYTAGLGGTTPYGKGGRGSGGDGVGGNGSGYGAGGGGGRRGGASTRLGGSGSQGVVIVEEYGR